MSQVGKPLPGTSYPEDEFGLSSHKLKRLRELADKYELADNMIADLRILESYEIVVIADDSGSMSTNVFNSSQPFGPKYTRWDEMKETLSMVVDFATIFDEDGIDVYFMNAGPYTGLKNPANVRALFDAVHPSGRTPLTSTFQKVLQDKARHIVDLDSRKLLILVATDGEPNNAQGYSDVAAFEKVLRSRKANRCAVSLLAVTDDSDATDWMNKLDDTLPYLDTTDDFLTERAQVEKSCGVKLTRGVWLTKCLLGPINATYDQLDARSAVNDRGDPLSPTSLAVKQGSFNNVDWKLLVGIVLGFLALNFVKAWFEQKNK